MRLRRRAEFTQVYEQGTRVRGRFMTCFGLANEAGSPRLGIAASRKIGGAVTRNRAKRRIRELFRTRKPLKNIDLVVIPRRELAAADWEILSQDYRAALHKLERMSREP